MTLPGELPATSGRNPGGGGGGVAQWAKGRRLAAKRRKTSAIDTSRSTPVFLFAAAPLFLPFIYLLRCGFLTGRVRALCVKKMCTRAFFIFYSEGRQRLKCFLRGGMPNRARRIARHWPSANDAAANDGQIISQLCKKESWTLSAFIRDFVVARRSPPPAPQPPPPIRAVIFFCCSVSVAPLDVLHDPRHEVSHARVEAGQCGTSAAFDVASREGKMEREKERE